MKKFCVRPAESKADSCIKEEESSVSSLLLSLTQDLQSMIYAKLPLQDLYKLRTCCWELYDVIHHDSFKLAAQVVAKSSCDLVRSSSAYYSPMFFSVGHDGVLEWAGYDVTSSKWSTLPSLNRLPSPDPGLLKEFLIAGDDGLLCINVAKVSLEAAAAPAPKLVIYNPLTQQIRELPPMNFPRHPVLMHLLVDKCGKNSYKVIVAGSSSTGTEHLSRKTEVYCSETQSWQVTGDLPGPDFGLNEYQNGAYCDGVLYCVALTTDDHVMHSSVSGCKVVLAYHVKKGKWLTNWYCPIPSFRSHAYFATTQIVALAGSIFVFSEQEYLKEVKFCIARLDCIEMGMGSQKKKFHLMEHQQQQPMSCKWYNNNNQSISKPQIVLQELLLQSEAPGRNSGILYGNSEGRNSGIPFGNSEPAPIVTHENFITKKHEEENLSMWSNVMNFRKFSEMGSKEHEEQEEELMWQRIQKERKEGKWEIVLEESKNGSRGLLVYPENTCVAQETISTSKKKHNLCIFNTVERTMIILDDFQNNNNNIHDHNHNNNNHKNSNNTSSYPIHNPIKLRENKKKFHSLNPLGFAFKPNFSASV